MMNTPTIRTETVRIDSALTTTQQMPGRATRSNGAQVRAPVSIEPTPQPFARNTQEYGLLLQDEGFDFTTRGPWAVVSDAERVQGWKLHLSSIPTEAAHLLRQVLPCLRAYGVSFKIARNADVLYQLNEGELGATQMGKFATIYPVSDEQAVALARDLCRITTGFHGPIVVTDLRLGDVVYTRYGGFNPVVTRDRLGQIQLSIYGPDGALQIDAYQTPFVCPEGIVNPFGDDWHYKPSLSNAEYQATASAADAPGSRLFGPGYLVLDVVKQHPKGSVFMCLDLRTQEQAGIKVLKQGRQYCMCDEYGRDIRVRLQRQAALHAKLASTLPIPQADAYFEVNGDGYLPLDYIEGQSIETLAVDTLMNRPWQSLAAAQQRELLSYLAEFVSIVQRMHKLGYVHRDLTASNIWIGADKRVYLLDLELAHAVADPTPAFGLGTTGFMSPNQAARRPPTFADDLYAIGCVMVLLLTGLDPRRVLFADPAQRGDQLLALTSGAPKPLLDVVAQCLHTAPEERPSLETISAAIEKCLDQLPLTTERNDDEVASARSFTPPMTMPDAHSVHQSPQQDILRHGLQGLLHDVLYDTDSGLWLSASIENSRHQGRSGATGTYELRRSTNRGVAGVVYLLGRLARFGYATTEAQARVQQAVDWLLTDAPTPDQQLPGLHFGDAGVAVAIAEAIAGKLIDRTPTADNFVAHALASPPDWPDITHGAAGQGVAALYCADILQTPELSRFAHPYAEYLLQNQQPDGSWAMPPGVDGMSGETLSGFAHGVAGMVYFLAAYARHFPASAASSAWQAGAEWLIGQALPADSPGKNAHALEWVYSDRQPTRWQWWCHGSPGIALTFLRLCEQTGDTRFADIAQHALLVHPADIRYGNLSQCHGLSGLGEIYLEAARVLGDEQWSARAGSIADTLYHLGRQAADGTLTWLVEDPHMPTADLMVGAGGVVHFFLRRALRDRKIGFPLLLGPE